MWACSTTSPTRRRLSGGRRGPRRRARPLRRAVSPCRRGTIPRHCLAIFLVSERRLTPWSCSWMHVRRRSGATCARPWPRACGLHSSAEVGAPVADPGAIDGGDRNHRCHRGCGAPEQAGELRHSRCVRRYGGARGAPAPSHRGLGGARQPPRRSRLIGSRRFRSLTST